MSKQRRCAGWAVNGVGTNFNDVTMFAGDLSKLGSLYSISLDDFEREILPTLQKSDSVILFDCRVDGLASKTDKTCLQNTIEK